MKQKTRAQIISFMSAKGGVGKTSIVVNIANFCAYNKMKVLLVDCDYRTKGATHFLGISSVSLKEGEYITFENIVDNILYRIEDEKNIDEKDCDKRELPVLSAGNFEFIPVGLHKVDFADSIAHHKFKKKSEEKPDGEKKLDDDSGSTLYEDSFGCFEKYLREVFVAYQEKYELIFLDLGAGVERFNDILGKMSNCICVVAVDNRLSLMSARDLKEDLWKKYKLEKIIPCYNLINEKNRDREYDRGFWSDPIRGFEYMEDFNNSFNNGEMLNLEEDKYVKTLRSIIKGLGVNVKKIDAEIQKRERKEQERLERLEHQKKQEKEREQEEQRKQEEQKRQEEERKREEQKRREARDIMIKMEHKRIDRWDVLIRIGIFLLMLMIIKLFVSFWNRAVVWIYGLINLSLIAILIAGLVWLKFYRKIIEEIIKYTGSDTEVREDETNDASEQ